MLLPRLLVLFSGLIFATESWLTGSWSGSFATDHGTSPLSIKANVEKKSATYAMEFMGSALSGAVDSLRVVGDSVSFAIGFDTQSGRGTIRFFGKKGDGEVAGQFRGYLGTQEMSRGPWSLRRQP